jgi:hypothetical protein
MTIPAPLRCSHCENWIRDDSYSCIEDFILCGRCRRTISEVNTINEAEMRWNLPTGTIKQDIISGKLYQFIDDGLIRKSGKDWLLHELVMKMYYEKKTLIGVRPRSSTLIGV